MKIKMNDKFKQKIPQTLKTTKNKNATKVQKLLKKRPKRRNHKNGSRLHRKL